ncbi:hypothetical protein [Paenibacillus sanguinis]|uniref:hypothetical protein n=1 Tax=Paenibacillus sanguinis TaxID=225906 RepID=UPI00036C5ED6|nr:hypothetical protein [Paenibacillus sanguinis]
MKQKIFLLVLTAMIVVVGGLYALSYMPRKIINIEPSNVSKIEIFDGNRGEQLIVTDEEQKKHLISNLNKISFRKEKLSIGYIGYKFRTTIYNKNGKVYKEIIINASDTLRYRGFFYTTESGMIDFDYIDSLFETNR